MQFKWRGRDRCDQEGLLYPYCSPSCPRSNKPLHMQPDCQNGWLVAHAFGSLDAEMRRANQMHVPPHILATCI